MLLLNIIRIAHITVRKQIAPHIFQLIVHFQVVAHTIYAFNCILMQHVNAVQILIQLCITVHVV